MQRGNRRQAHSRVSSGADYKPVAFPGYLVFDRQGRMPRLSTEYPGRCRPAVEDFSSGAHAPTRAAGFQALFFEVTAENADQLCSTS
jgi:hypothetical protein